MTADPQFYRPSWSPPSTPKVSAEVPLLRLGIDRLPQCCTACGGGLLNGEPPLGSERFGTLTCTACGVVLAHLTQAPRSIRTTPHPQTVRRLPPSPVDVSDWRLDGCGKDCRQGSHAAAPHEMWGRFQAYAEVKSRQTRPTGQVVTGALVVDFGLMQARVGGENVKATPTEFRILALLAENLGRLVTGTDLLRLIFDVQAERPLPNDRRRGATTMERHALRTNISRLRTRLGVAAQLVETVPNQGYTLRREATP